MKKCELCNSPAKLFCESDQATLCWVCDAKVHSANFLVTKHSRFLLCHLCQSMTPWHGSGPKFVPTMSVCNDCTSDNTKQGFKHQNDEDRDHSSDDDDGDDDDDDGGGDDDDDDDGGGDDEEEEEEEEADEDDEDEENQVVPWKSTPPPPPISSSSNSSNYSSRFSNGEDGLSD